MMASDNPISESISNTADAIRPKIIRYTMPQDLDKAMRLAVASKIAKTMDPIAVFASVIASIPPALKNARIAATRDREIDLSTIPIKNTGKARKIRNPT